MTRQRKQQLAKIAKGLCILCPEPLVNKNYCLKHAVSKREKYRALMGRKRRNSNSRSYWLEKQTPMTETDRRCLGIQDWIIAAAKELAMDSAHTPLIAAVIQKHAPHTKRARDKSV